MREKEIWVLVWEGMTHMGQEALLSSLISQQVP